MLLEPDFIQHESTFYLIHSNGSFIHLSDKVLEVRANVVSGNGIPYSIHGSIANKMKYQSIGQQHLSNDYFKRIEANIIVVERMSVTTSVSFTTLHTVFIKPLVDNNKTNDRFMVVYMLT